MELQLFKIIGGTWVVGMAGYILLFSKKQQTGHRCNVKKEVMRHKMEAKKLTEATSKKGGW